MLTKKTAKATAITLKARGLLLREIKSYVPLFLILLLITTKTFASENQKNELPFAVGEQLTFDIHYKWGFIMTKAGTAKYSISETKYNGKPVYRSSLSFKTTSGFDKIFKIRDTLHSYTNMKLEPVYHKKYLHEGSTNYIEELIFQEYGTTGTKARSLRHASDGTTRFDKVLESPTIAFDMVSIFMFARTMDYSNLVPGTTINLGTFVGRDMVKMKARYTGQVILEKSSDKKYKALKFELDIVDDAFETNKTAIELWISDDQNRLPLKIKAKLKIGAAEADLASFSGNKYPLSSLVVIKPRD